MRYDVLGWKTRMLRLSLTGALLCGAVVSGLVAPVLADANGDNAVDVRDMQTVVAAVLAGNAPKEADVNHDGRVDVLDLQQIVSAVENAFSTEQEAPVGEIPAVLPRTILAVVLPVPIHPIPDQQVVAVSPFLLVQNREAGFCQMDQLRASLSSTPHAPPLLG